MLLVSMIIEILSMLSMLVRVILRVFFVVVKCFSVIGLLLVVCLVRCLGRLFVVSFLFVILLGCFCWYNCCNLMVDVYVFR